MHALLLVIAFLALSGFVSAGGNVSPPLDQEDKILLSSVQTLTLRYGLSTTHRREPAKLQLKCTAGNACRYWAIDVLRCKNDGLSDLGTVEWSCKPTYMPVQFRMVDAVVTCEGYDNDTDPYILRGSCGARYSLVITSAGYQDGYGREVDWAKLAWIFFSIFAIPVGVFGGLWLVIFFTCLVAETIRRYVNGGEREGLLEGQGESYGTVSG